MKHSPHVRARCGKRPLSIPYNLDLNAGFSGRLDRQLQLLDCWQRNMASLTPLEVLHPLVTGIHANFEVLQRLVVRVADGMDPSQQTPRGLNG